MFSDVNPSGRPEAIFEILIMLLVAAVLGFVIAWLLLRYRSSTANTASQVLRLQKIVDTSREAEKELVNANMKLQNQLDDCLATKTEVPAAVLLANDTELQRLQGVIAQREAAETEWEGKLMQLQNEYTTFRNTADQSALEFEQRLAAKNAQIADLQATYNLAPPDNPEEVDEVLTATAPTEADKKDITLAKIREKAKDFDYTNMGTATATDRDDLKVIVGIGPFIEEKLNALGIYTFRQISRFNADDVGQVTQAIAFFPGRIERDNWIVQAGELANQKEQA